MENKLEKILLYETYKEMLTLNMQDVFEQYYYSDLSLREIAQNNEVSFQAIRDTLKKAEKQLEDMESKIGMLKLKLQVTSLKEDINKSKMDLEELKTKINNIGE